MDITINSDSINSQKKENRRKEYTQEDYHMPFDKNEANESMNAIKTVGASEKVAQIASKTFEVGKTIKKNASKKVKAVKAKYFLTCIKNILAQSIQMTTLFGKIITRDQMTGMEQLGQILLPTTEIGGSVSITNTFKTETTNQTNLDIQPTILHFKNLTELEHSELNHFPIRSLDSGIDVPRTGRILITTLG